MNPKNNRDLYEMQNRRRSAKKQSKSPGVAVLVVFLLTLLNTAGAGVLIALLILGVLAWLGFRLGKKYMAGRSMKDLTDLLSGKEKAEEDEGYCKTCSDEFVYNNRQTEYNEHGQEDSLDRDHQRRIRQLDHFLKNGLIDRQEYQVLLSHYEKRSQ